MRARGWRGELALHYERRGARTVLARRRHSGPILVQKPLYPEGEQLCHGIVLHPPGGIVGGDELTLRVDLAAGAKALLTTPGASKWYRSAGAEARQTACFAIAPGASLEWLPQPTIVFDRTLGAMSADVTVSGDACYIGWELLCLGRTAAGERLRAGRLRTRTRIRCESTPLWIERAQIEGGTRFLESPLGLDQQPISGTLVAVARSIGSELVGACRRVLPVSGRGAVTRLPGLLVARYLGGRAEAGFDYFVGLWHVLRPVLIGRDAARLRIWRT